MPLSTTMAIGAVAATVLLARLAKEWLKYRGSRVIQCPENLRPAGVVLDVAHAAVTGFGKAPELRLRQCSRWPELAGCGQQCLSQIQAAPEDSLVRNIIVKWYGGKSCVTCG